jgi:hypothetical protein
VDSVPGIEHHSNNLCALRFDVDQVRHPDSPIRNGENDTDDAGAGNPMSRKARDMGHPRRSFAYGNVKIENDSITWEMIDRAAEELSKENERAE